MSAINKKIDFSRNITVSVEMKDLEMLGWNFFDVYESTFNANNFGNILPSEDPEINMKRAVLYVWSNYYCIIVVNETGQTFWYLIQNNYSSGKNSESSDIESTGDDEQTIKDLKKLYSENKLFNIKKF